MAAAASSAIRPVSFLLPLPPSGLTDTFRSLSFPGLLRPLPRLLSPPRSLRSSLCPPRRLSPIVFVAAAQSNLFKVIQTAWRIGRDVTDAGANLVPDSKFQSAVPRPVARIGVAIAAITIALFVLKSFLSTAFFILAVMGLIYFGFVALNADEVSNSRESTTSSDEQTLEEARRIMEKYK